MTPRAALERLLAIQQKCHRCNRAATHRAYSMFAELRSCADHKDRRTLYGEDVQDQRDDEYADAIEAAEAALTEVEPVVTIEPHGGFGGMFRICLPGIDHEWVDDNTARIAAAVAEALGWKVVRR